MTIQSKPVTNESPTTPGWYPFGRPGSVAEWDGHAWTSQSRPDESVAEPAKRKHHPFRFLGHRWFWAVAVGNLIVIGGGLLMVATDSKPLTWAVVVVGMIVFGAGVVLLVDRREAFGQLTTLRPLLLWGIVSGLVAFALAVLIENRLEPDLGLPTEARLWLAGPVEETLKLAIPFLLLVFGGSRFKDPRAGLLLVILSGVVLGGMEAAQYTAQSDLKWTPLLMGIIRPGTELIHPLLTGFAAGVIWLAAWRARRPVTAVGVGAWVLAMAIHSLHDGLMGRNVNTSTLKPPTMESAGEAVAVSVVVLVPTVVLAVLFFLLLRHAARELVPPDVIGVNAPHWRPQLKRWGVPRADRGLDQDSTSPPVGGTATG